jgi:N-acetylglucosamine kinase-like BadF-type ATPase
LHTDGAQGTPPHDPGHPFFLLLFAAANLFTLPLANIFQKMILIADAGATNIQWVVIHDGKASERIETAGFNPYFMEPQVLTDAVEKDLVPFINPGYIRQVYYYGAGCSTVIKCGVVEDVLKEVFENADFEIYHDLLGAARALFGRKEGIACILGTGSNSCLYGGKEILENVTSLGYLFGDEGSGAYLGKLWLTEYLRGRMPGHLKKLFDDRYGYSLENILDSVYSKPHPNRFLSSFSIFIGDLKNDEFVKGLVRKNFHDFFTEQVTQYTDFAKRPLGVIGSVGYHFQDIFKEVAAEYSLEVSKIIQSPIEGLVEYHGGK